ncbi:hypothetical protein [Buttiauxella massiliensis]|uniref:hypothetical protein n=1 Tax=Buttiauxella massiliensis TaxID=2831590 RepID=UPI00125F89C6|nr:hypothetical protein [Buttiauxella massiliensis]
MDTDNISALLSRVSGVKNESQKVDKAADEIEAVVQAQIHRDGKTRSTLTLTFMRGFFGLLIFSFFFVLIYNYCAVQWSISLKAAGLLEESKSIALLEVDKVLSIMISALGTSLGFIIGYYFKEKK